MNIFIYNFIGGERVEATDPSCTHHVVEDGHTVDSSEYMQNVYIVKNEVLLAFNILNHLHQIEMWKIYSYHQNFLYI